MEDSGELHTPNALCPGKELPVAIKYVSGWALEAVRTH
jgi:hypothetical protein